MAKKRTNELNELNMADYIFNESGEASEKSKEKSSPKKDKKEVSKPPSPQSVKRAEKGADPPHLRPTPADDRPGKGRGPVLLLLRGICRRATYPKGIR